MKILIKISYLGTNYRGFQAQKNGVTIQSKLNDASKELFGFDCNITGCSRTDSGVHALGFCATVEPSDKNQRHNDWCRIPMNKFPEAINIFLPPDIAVCAAVWVNDEFHARYDIEYKEYIYKIFDNPIRNPLLFGRAYQYKRKISDEGIKKMNEAAKAYIGTYDFSSFMAQGSKIVDTVRCVKYASVYRNGECVEFKVAADGFLYNMVRIMTGTLIDVANNKTLPSDIFDIINSKDRSKAGVTVPPEGLYLSKAVYHNDIDIWKGCC